MDGSTLTRRGSLAALGGIVAAAVGARFAETADDGLAAVASGAVTCVLTPELTEGPYYIAGENVRRDITDGHRGTQLLLKTTIVEVRTCKAIQNAAVDVWHADAAGVYSGFGSGASSRTFMRGVQKTDRNGLAVFKTVYPGWYPGRAVHIHVKVHVGGNVVHTGQLFFPDAVTDDVYRAAPYASRGNRDMRNAHDAIFVNGGSKSVAHVAKSSNGYVASIAMGVHR